MQLVKAAKRWVNRDEYSKAYEDAESRAHGGGNLGTCESSYWAILTAPILESSISDGAKLFYAQLSRFTDKTGCCWASNRTLSSTLGLGERTITRYVAELEAAGFIVTEVAGVSDRKRHRERHIRLASPVPFNLAKNGEIKVAKNGEIKVAKNGEINLAKNGEILDGINNNYKLIPENINPLEPPTGGQRVPEQAKWMPERFERFWAFYRKNVNPANRAAARRAWDKLRPDEDLIRAIGAALVHRLKADDEWRRGIGRPHASTYLNGQMWLDECKAAPPAPRREDDDERKEAFGVWT